ncbi:hypothetical protein LSAT2_031561 [Lamellibrachia satsuma]|nr:hypothetical protein LSAT2_031561 [Lamellibrachia satsuma]
MPGEQESQIDPNLPPNYDRLHSFASSQRGGTYSGDHPSDVEDDNATDQPVTSQPASSGAVPMPMPQPTEKTNLQETGPIPTYGVDH